MLEQVNEKAFADIIAKMKAINFSHSTLQRILMAGNFIIINNPQTRRTLAIDWFFDSYQLSAASTQHLQLLAEVIQLLKITHLNITDKVNNHHHNQRCLVFTLLNANILAPSVTHLTLQQTSLGYLTDAEWDIVCEKIKNSNVIHIKKIDDTLKGDRALALKNLIAIKQIKQSLFGRCTLAITHYQKTSNIKFSLAQLPEDCKEKLALVENIYESHRVKLK